MLMAASQPVRLFIVYCREEEEASNAKQGGEVVYGLQIKKAMDGKSNCRNLCSLEDFVQQTHN